MPLVFVVDTSPAMAQRAANGMSFLDLAKVVVADLVAKMSSQGHDTLLVTCNQPPATGHSFGGVDAVLADLRNLQPRPVFGFRQALAEAVEAVHLKREFGQDKYGSGWDPAVVSPTTYVLITGTTAVRSAADLSLPLGKFAGLSAARLRWDERIIALEVAPAYFAPASAESTTRVLPAAHPLARLCGSTGGVARTLRAHSDVRAEAAVLGNAISNDKWAAGVTMRGFSSRGDAFFDATVCTLAALAVSKQWPIPEHYCPSPTMHRPPPRDIRPTLLVDMAPSALDSGTLRTVLHSLRFPIAVYRVQACPSHVRKAFIGIARRAATSPEFPVYVHGSSGDDTRGQPVGFLTLNTNPVVHVPGVPVKAPHAPPDILLALCPYDYPTLFSLLATLRLRHEEDPDLLAGWEMEQRSIHGLDYQTGALYLRHTVDGSTNSQLRDYLGSIPAYYRSAIVTNMRVYGLGKLANDAMRSLGHSDPHRFSPQTQSYLKSWERDAFRGGRPAARRPPRSRPQRVTPPTEPAPSFLAPAAAGAGSAPSGASAPPTVDDVWERLRRLGSGMPVVAPPLAAPFSAAEAPTAVTLPPPPVDDGASVYSCASTASLGGTYHFHSHVRHGPKQRRQVTLKPTAVAAQEDAAHAVPIASMGQYQKVLASREFLRDPHSDPESAADPYVVFFGNPYQRRSKGKRALPQLGGDEFAAEAAVLGAEYSSQGGDDRPSRRRRLSAPTADSSADVLQVDLPPGSLTAYSLAAANTLALTTALAALRGDVPPGASVASTLAASCTDFEASSAQVAAFRRVVSAIGAAAGVHLPASL